MFNVFWNRKTKTKIFNDYKREIEKVITEKKLTSYMPQLFMSIDFRK